MIKIYSNCSICTLSGFPHCSNCARYVGRVHAALARIEQYKLTGERERKRERGKERERLTLPQWVKHSEAWGEGERGGRDRGLGKAK